MDEVGDIQVLGNSEPLFRSMGLLFSLIQDLRCSDGTIVPDLDVRPLGPEMNVRAVFPAILLFRPIQGQHSDQDSVFVILWHF